jgi:hypothetical protein
MTVSFHASEAAEGQEEPTAEPGVWASTARETVPLGHCANDVQTNETERACFSRTPRHD